MFSLLYIFDNFIPFTKFEIATGFREFTCMYFGVAIFGLAVFIKIKYGCWSDTRFVKIPAVFNVHFVSLHIKLSINVPCLFENRVRRVILG